MITPVLRRNVFVKGDIVESLIKDQEFDCVYVGQTARISRIEDQMLIVLLKCGHPWYFSKTQVKKIGHESCQETNLSISFLKETSDERKPIRRRKVGRSKI